MRPRQARYQAALRPDRLCVLIIRDLPTEMFERCSFEIFRPCASTLSIIEFSVTSATTVRLFGLPGSFAQRDNGLFGSASIGVTAAPWPANWVASSTAEVDFPVPSVQDAA